MYTIAVDCMGSDNGPKVCVEAIKIFLNRHSDVRVVAFGREEDLKDLKNVNNVEVVHCEDVMEMTAGSLEAMRKRKSSMYQAIVSTKENEYDGVISAGSTGAFLTLASVKLKTVEGVDRAALVTALPSYDGKQVTVLDVGANVETTGE